MLARQLGMSVARAQQEISAREFAEWMAYDRIDPMGEGRADLRAGIIAAVMRNSWCKGAPAKPADFMPNFKRQDGPDPEQLQQKIRAIFKGIANGSKDRAHSD